MTTKRARSIALLALTAGGSTALVAQVTTHQHDAPPSTRSAGTSMTTEQPAPRWALCGAGEYRFTAAGQPAGTETFDVQCRPDGSYAATGRTQLTPLGLDLTTTLELAKDLLPRNVEVKGTVRGQPFDQTAKFDNGTATVTSGGAAQTVSYAPSASWLGGNIFFANAFIVARYDEAKGGAQQLSVFPQTTITIERMRPDTVAHEGARATFDRYVMRAGGQEITLWRDAEKRLAVIGVVAQRFAAARAESARWVEALLAAPATSAPSSSPNAAASAIDYSAPPDARFTAEEVKITVGTYELAGTLLVPKTGTHPFPSAVMITGSGLQTRDSRLPLPGLEGYAPFRQIAERLAANGVAVLRVDDRGIGGSTGRETLEKATTTTLAEDTRAQVAWLRKRGEIDPNGVTLIGHSEGASIAAMVAASDPKVRSIIIMAGMGKTGAEVAIEQHEELLKSDTTLDEATRAARRAQQKDAVKTIMAGGDVPGVPVNAWTREYFAYDPLATVRKVKQPILILQGERDRQVDQSHAPLLADAARAAGNTSVTVKVFPTLNHLFLPSETGSFTEYSRLGTTTVPDVVLDAIADWIGQRNR
ncbi:MAG TPA: alpha/beta fold hydrolase [Gemmatimonadaceae bacterium]|nr:alpha/beta fold hydrolase [Gemmatimonadaceae bacterium]